MPISEIPSLRLLRHVTSAAYVSVEKVPAFPRLLDSTNVTQWSTLCLWGVFTSGLVHNIWLGNWSGILMLAAALSLSFPDLASIKKSALGWFGSEPGSTASRMRPMFFFCSASHARFTPEKRRFKYPMLYVGFPATLKGGVSGGSRLFSVLPSPTETTTRTPPRSIFTVDPAKYFSPDLSFVEKLHQVLAGHVS